MRRAMPRACPRATRARHSAEPLFTPVPRLKIRGGFGRHGTGCREFRHLDRACGEMLLLVDLSFEEAAQVVKDGIAEIRAEAAATSGKILGKTHSWLAIAPVAVKPPLVT